MEQEIVMKSQPRWHTGSRWPNDPQDTLNLANTDLAYVKIMKASDVDTPELRRIAKVAQERLDWAVAKLNKGSNK